MAYKCSIAGCWSHNDKGEVCLPLFSLPKQEPLRSQWLKSIPHDLSQIATPMICSKHFEESSFIWPPHELNVNEMKLLPRTPKLKEKAIPTIFQNNPQSQEKKNEKSQNIKDYSCLDDSSLIKIFAIRDAINLYSIPTQNEPKKEAEPKNSLSLINLDKENKKMEDKDTFKHPEIEMKDEVTNKQPDTETKDEDSPKISDKEMEDEDTLQHPDAQGNQENNNSNNNEEVIMTGQEYLDFVTEIVKEGIQTSEMNLAIQLDAEIKTLEEKVKQKEVEVQNYLKYFKSYVKNMEDFAKFKGISPLSTSTPTLITRGLQVGTSFINVPSVPLGALEVEPIKAEIVNSEKKSQIESISNKIDAKSLSISNKTEVKSLPSNKTNAKHMQSTSTAANSIEIVDLTEEEENLPSSTKPLTGPVSTTHPAPLPPLNLMQTDIIPKPLLTVQAENHGIVLKWEILPAINLECPIVSYQIFGYQEPKITAPQITSAMWQNIGTVEAMQLPMQCTLSKFIEGSKYHFIIRGVSANNRHTYFSEPKSVIFFPLNPKSKKL